MVFKYLDDIIIIVSFCKFFCNKYLTLYFCMISVLMVVFKYLDDIIIIMSLICKLLCNKYLDDIILVYDSSASGGIQVPG